MTTLVRGSLLFLVIALFTASSTAQSADEQLVERGKSVINLMNEGKFAEVVAQFDDRMKQALTVERLEQTWKTIIGQAGEFKGISETSTMKVQNMDVVMMTCNFEKISLQGALAFDPEKKIAGFQMVPKQ